MQENTESSHANCNEELHDILIAISVVAKKLAKNICENHETKEEQSDEQIC